MAPSKKNNRRDTSKSTTMPSESESLDTSIDDSNQAVTEKQKTSDDGAIPPPRLSTSQPSESESSDDSDQAVTEKETKTSDDGAIPPPPLSTSQPPESESSDKLIDDSDQAVTKKGKLKDASKKTKKRENEGSDDNKKVKKNKKQIFSEEDETALLPPRPESSTKKIKKRENENVKKDDKKMIKRLFTEETEIALLQGIIDYSAETGMYPMRNLVAFTEFIKGSLPFEVNGEQLKNKIKRMKKRFRNINDQKWYALSKKIWAGGEASTQNPPSVGTGLEKMDLWWRAFEESVLKPTDEDQSDDSWTELHIAKLELLLEESKRKLKATTS